MNTSLKSFLFGCLEFLAAMILMPIIFTVSLLAQLTFSVKSLLVSSGQRDTWKPSKNQKYAIVVTGASSGIGKALVLEYARAYTMEKVDLRFGLLGTNEERLQQVETELIEKFNIKPAYIVKKAVDVRNQDQMKLAIEEFETRFNGINLLVANAGVSEFVLKSQNNDIDFENLQRGIIDINLIGALNTVLPIVNKVVNQKRYRDEQTINIALVSSIAGESSFLSAYASMKKGLTELCRFLRWKLKPNTFVNVSVVCPGWVDTHMASKFPGSKIGMIDSQSAAEKIRSGLEEGYPVIAFPYAFYVLSRVVGSMPTGLVEAIMQFVNPDHH